MNKKDMIYTMNRLYDSLSDLRKAHEQCAILCITRNLDGNLREIIGDAMVKTQKAIDRLLECGKKKYPSSF